jgi:hypothetical protein
MYVQFQPAAGVSTKFARRPPHAATLVEGRIGAFGRRDVCLMPKSNAFEVEVEGELGADFEFVVRDGDGRVIPAHVVDGERKTYVLPPASLHLLILTVWNFAEQSDWFKARVSNL